MLLTLRIIFLNKAKISLEKYQKKSLDYQKNSKSGSFHSKEFHVTTDTLASKSISEIPRSLFKEIENKLQEGSKTERENE